MAINKRAAVILRAVCSARPLKWGRKGAPAPMLFSDIEDARSFKDNVCPTSTIMCAWKDVGKREAIDMVCTGYHVIACKVE